MSNKNYFIIAAVSILLFVGGLWAGKSGIHIGQCPCPCCDCWGISFPSKCPCPEPKPDVKPDDHKPHPRPPDRPSVNPFGATS